MKAFRYALFGVAASLVVGFGVGFLTFTHAPAVGTGAVAFYSRVVVGIFAASIAAAVVWVASVAIIQAKMSAGVIDHDDDPFDDPFFDK